MELRELEDSALRILTFFTSRQAKKIVLINSFALGITSNIIAGPILNFLFPAKATFEWGNPMWAMVVFAHLWFCLTTLIFTSGNHSMLLAHYALKHWEEIQKNHEPWPVDKPYLGRLEDVQKAIWKKIQKLIQHRGD